MYTMVQITLSQEQEQAFERFQRGENLFLTGPGGSGKSELVRTMYRHAVRARRGIQVCAMTGCAAQLLDCDARTLHSWAGIGLGKGSADELARTIMRKMFVAKRWRTTDVLIVDEVSMMSQPLFETLDIVGRLVRGRKDLPFGGIQLVFVGDFYQLPPCDQETAGPIQFCFQSPAWFSVFPVRNHIVLVRIFRQRDLSYVNILNQVRTGKIKRSSYNVLMERVGCQPPPGIIRPTLLFPKKHKVNQVNQERMEALKGAVHEFDLTVNWDPEALREVDPSLHEPSSFGHVSLSSDETNFENELNYMRRNLMCDDKLKLKVGAQVMCLVNIVDKNLFNGSQGIVERFDPLTGHPMVRFYHDKERLHRMEQHTWESDRLSGLSVSQIPLVLAWALTIHKSQGTTLDVAEIDVGSDIFEHGQTYVALSRVKSLEGLFLTSFDVSKIKINLFVHSFYEQLRVRHELEDSAVSDPSTKRIRIL